MKEEKKYGKVTKYNGIYGNIKDINGIDYKLLDKNTIDKNIKELDNVEFEQDIYKTEEVEINIARFVKLLKKDK